MVYIRRFQAISHKVKKNLKKIHLVDKCLIILMIILMIQATYTLFSKGMNSSEVNSIDIVVRTSAAAIFGYFLSANFVKDSENKDDLDCNEVIAKREALDHAGIQNKKQGSIKEEAEKNVENRLQVIIATCMGIFCLMVLIALRNFMELNPDIKESHNVMITISQFRDFVSSCVGFLIGCPTSQSKNR